MGINRINIYKIHPISKLEPIKKKGEIKNHTHGNHQNPPKSTKDNSNTGNFDEILKEEIKKTK